MLYGGTITVEYWCYMCVPIYMSSILCYIYSFIVSYCYRQLFYPNKTMIFHSENRNVLLLLLRNQLKKRNSITVAPTHFKFCRNIAFSETQCTEV